MKKIQIFTVFFLSLLFAVHRCSAQYGQDNSKLNSNLNLNRNNPTAETIFTADTTINHVDFGQQSSKRAFVIVFPFKRIRDNDRSSFDFKASEIRETRMTKNSGVSQIELTSRGFELTYIPKKRKGVVDDYVAIRTDTGDIILRLTGEIIDPKKKLE